MHDILCEAQKMLEQTSKDRRTIHNLAETGFNTCGTAKYIHDRLEEYGIACTPCGKNGIIADIGKSKKGGAVLLRADMDALPIRELSDENFAATNGAMHACGHDMHSAMLLCAAGLLKKREAKLTNKVRLAFQPAEELLSGAKNMIKHGLLEGMPFSCGYMLHVLPAIDLSPGTVILPPPGAAAPFADVFKIEVYGKSAHGATPEKGKDALVCAAAIVSTLQSIVSREISPADQAVITVGKINGGTAPNVIADYVCLYGNARCFGMANREYLAKRIKETAVSTGKAMGLNCTVSLIAHCPELYNYPSLIPSAHSILSSALPENKIIRSSRLGNKGRSLGGSEDFAYISKKLPSLTLSLAAGKSADGYTEPLHHPKVRFDERCMPYGAAALTALALNSTIPSKQ